ncbi:hypothetical protein [Arthrobacter sp. NA-172]|uniref:hypothetical protein n=1 Tax=Arthrobacter sp. NA-172 TaxID=3367524 RepID=UPI003753F8F5
MPECEAARRNKQALYEIELAWGNGIVDLGKLRGILMGSEREAEPLEVCLVEDSHRS